MLRCGATSTRLHIHRRLLLYAEFLEGTARFFTCIIVLEVIDVFEDISYLRKSQTEPLFVSCEDRELVLQCVFL